MRGWATAPLLMLAACGSHDEPAAGSNSAGDRLEAAAVAAGLVIDPAGRDIVGAWSRDTDHACIVPGGEGDDPRIGLLIDYGANTGCAASGTLRRHGTALDLRFGECRIEARLDGDRIVLPAEVPAACDRACTGHATLASMTLDHQSDAASEARSLRAPSGRLLCAP